MKLAVELGRNPDPHFRLPRLGRTRIAYHDGTTDTVMWAAVLGYYIELTIAGGEA